MGTALLIGIMVAAVVAAIAVLLRTSEGRRAQELARVAAERGFSFEAAGSPFSEQERNAILRFTRHGPTARNLMRGSAAGGEVVIFDHHGQGRRETVAAFRASAPDFELFTLRHGMNPKVMGPVFARLGFVVLCFDSHPEFCDNFLLMGRDEAALRRLFTPALLSSLNNLDKEKRWAIESAGGWLLVCRSGHLIPPAEIAGFLEEAAGVAGLFRSAAAKGAGA